MPIRGVHVLGFVAVVLGVISIRATEHYTARYQTLPILDWLESRPPLAEAARVPQATDLVRGLLRAAPLLTIHADARPLSPVFGPPAVVQRSMGGVRDAASIELGLPGAVGEQFQPVQARLEVIVFNRAGRAAAWADLMALQMDIRDPHAGQPQVRLTAQDSRDGLWIVAPRAGVGGTATLAGWRGPVAFELIVACRRSGATRPETLLELSALAETIARDTGGSWATWVEAHLASA
jgi:hypothetical protein